MILLNRYILAQFTRTFFTVAGAFIAIYILVDSLEKIDNFMTAGKSIGLIVKFFLLNIPFIIDQLGPILILLAGVISLGLLNHNNELTAMMAGGLSLRTIVKPILIGALLFTTFFLAMAQWILPHTIAATNTIWYEEVNNMVPLGIFRNGRFYYQGKEGFFSFARPWLDKDIFINFSYSSWNNDYSLQTLVTAKKAEWKNFTWKLSEGQIQEKSSPDNYTTALFESKEFTFPETPDQFFVPEYQAAELSLTELFQSSVNQSNHKETIEAKTNFYSRISYTLLGLPLLLLGLPVLLISYKKWGKDLSVAIPASCAMAFIAWGVWGALQSLARADYFSPFLAAVLIHILFGGAGFLLLHKQGT
ncbi:MAG: LptF/LptG family permease [Proteobacteria bacterium]|nr:LptF/LptG family permease [Pseudomonadota bacterium]MBU1060924.1 LptF/LptG family permease [Pseudomonadota bacterium]